MARIVRQTNIGVKISKHPATAGVAGRSPQMQEGREGQEGQGHKDEFSPAFINAESHRTFVANLFAIRSKTARSTVKATSKPSGTASI